MSLTSSPVTVQLTLSCLSLPQLAAQAGRCLRTIQKNIACLQVRSLLVERVERKTFRQPDGSSTSRLVVVKDFTALYTLAHEYHEWLHAENLIPPERAFAHLIAQDPSLVTKLRRFENYRRLLSHHLAATGPGEREEERWLSKSLTISSTAGQAPASQPSKDQASASKVTATRMAIRVAKDSPKRITETSQWNIPPGDSSDSAFSSSGSFAKDQAARALPDQPAGWSQQGNPPSTRLIPSAPEPPDQEQQAYQTEPSRGSARLEGVPRKPKAECLHQTPRASRQHQSGSGQQPPPPGTPAPCSPDHPLARSFVQQISIPFGDRNPKGSVTRILKMLAPAGLEDTEVLLCLIRAYTIARDTRTIRSTHVDEQGQANRMPLFCTLVERFVQARIQHGKWDYSWQQMEEDLAADVELTRWWAQQGTHVLSPGKGPTTCQMGAAAATPYHDPFGSEPFIPGPEWDRQESAHFWGECLLEALVTAGYQAEVRVRPVEQGYHLVLRGDGDEWILETTRQVQDVIKRIKRASRSSWSSCPPNGRRE